MRHGDRARVARLDLREQREHCAPHHVRARPWLRPRARVRAVRDGRPDHLVVRRVVLHLVDAVAPAVVRAQHGLVDVRELGRALEVPRPDERADLDEPVLAPRPAVRVHRLAQHGVVEVLVDPLALRRLVGHAVGRAGYRVRDGGRGVGDACGPGGAGGPGGGVAAGVGRGHGVLLRLCGWLGVGAAVLGCGPDGRVGRVVRVRGPGGMVRRGQAPPPARRRHPGRSAGSWRRRRPARRGSAPGPWTRRRGPRRAATAGR